MVFASDDYEVRIRRFVNEAMLVRDAARPKAFERGFERFGFTDALKRRFGALSDEATDAFKYFLISSRLIAVIVESGLVEGNDSH